MRYGFVVPLMLCAFASPVAKSHAAEDGTTVSIEDIQSGKVPIIGKLGLAIGTVVEITGEWIGPGPSAELTKIGPELTFRVTRIGGDLLKEPLIFLERDVRIIPGSTISKEAGQRLTVYAFESCQFLGIPAAAWGGGRSPVAADRQFGLYSRLELVRRVDRAEGESTGHEAGEGKPDLKESTAPRVIPAQAADREGKLPKNETVMSPGMRIQATTPVGEIVVTAVDDLTRSYTWEGATRSVEMWPRAERWYGSLGLYYPGPGEHWREHKGITRAVTEEGQQHFESVDEAVEWIQSLKWMPYVYRDDGLVVGWNKSPSRNQLNVEVWQILVNGEKPARLPGSQNEKIVDTQVEP